LEYKAYPLHKDHPSQGGHLKAKPISFEKLEVSLTSDMAEPIGQVTEETPFHMLILGDFSGQANRQAQDEIPRSKLRGIRKAE